MPEGAFPALSWDLSPLRPWEWGQADAQQWTEAQAVRAAYNEGLQDARDEHQASEDLKGMVDRVDDRRQALLERMRGQ